MEEYQISEIVHSENDSSAGDWRAPSAGESRHGIDSPAVELANRHSYQNPFAINYIEPGVD